MESRMDFYTAPSENEQNNSSNPKKAFAVASLVCGIISILAICCAYISPILGLLGIIFAIISRYNGRFDGLGIAGLITSIIGFIFGSLFLAYTIFVMYVLANPEKFPDLYPIFKQAMDEAKGITEGTTTSGNFWYILNWFRK